MATRAHPNTPEKPTRRLTTIVASDICGYSSLSEQSDALAIDVVDEAYNLFEAAVSNYQGRIFKRVADGFLAEFQSAESAMHAAIEFTKSVKENSHNANLNVRTGIHVGDVTERIDGDLLGHGVNIAVRLQEQARENGILASHNIINLLSQNFPYEKTRRGALPLKNILKPILVFDVNENLTARALSKNTFRYIIVIAVLVLVSLIVGFFAIETHHSTSKQNLEKIALEHFPIAEGAVEDQEYYQFKKDVSAGYIRNVLKNLNESRVPSQRTAFALLESGNIPEAIASLERSLKFVEFSGEEYVNIMHQIAALAYHYDPEKAVAYYESLLELNPKDRIASLWLVRTYNLIGDADQAYELYEDLVEKQDTTPKEKLQLKLDMAFNQMLNAEFQTAADMLLRTKGDIEAFGDRRLILEWQTNLSIAFERLDMLGEAQAMLLEVAYELNEIGMDTNLPRAYNVLGQIEEKKALQNLNESDIHLRSALKYYELQYDVGIKINKKLDIAESLYSMGNVWFSLGDSKKAHKNYLEGLRLSREYNLTTPELVSRIGLGRVEKVNGNQDAACSHVEKAEQFYTSRMNIPLSPKIYRTLEDLGCGWLTE